jgi:hypothetical protein
MATPPQIPALTNQNAPERGPERGPEEEAEQQSHEESQEEPPEESPEEPEEQHAPTRTPQGVWKHGHFYGNWKPDRYLSPIDKVRTAPGP